MDSFLKWLSANQDFVLCVIVIGAIAVVSIVKAIKGTDDY